METMKWMVTFAYILDGLNTSTKNENCLYTCCSIIEGLKAERIKKKECMSNQEIAIIACNIYSFVKEEGFIDAINVNKNFNYVNDYLKDESIQDLELILMTDD